MHLPGTTTDETPIVNAHTRTSTAFFCRSLPPAVNSACFSLGFFGEARGSGIGSTWTRCFSTHCFPIHLFHSLVRNPWVVACLSSPHPHCTATGHREKGTHAILTRRMQLPYGDPILDATTDVVIIASAVGWALMHIMTRVALPADRTPQGSFQEEAKKRRKAERDFLLDAVPGIPCKYGTRKRNACTGHH